MRHKHHSHHTLVAVALVLVPLSAEARAQAQLQVRPDSTIAVTVSRTAHVAPDRAALYVVVEGTAETAADANARVDTKLRSVTEALRGFGSRVEAAPPIGYGVNPAPSPNGYPGAMNLASSFISRAVVRVQVNRIDQLSQIVAGVMAAGASSTTGITFESSVADSVRRDRMTETAVVARSDAQALAAALGGHLGSLVDATYTSNNFGFPGQSGISFDNRFNPQSAAPDVPITTTVAVRYRLVR